MITNGKKIFSTRSSVGNLGVLNGLRVISMMWIVLGHAVVNLVGLPNINASKILQVSTVKFAFNKYWI